MQYIYKGQPIEILQLVFEDDEWLGGDEQDFGPYAYIRLEDGTTTTVYMRSLSPNPEDIIMGTMEK